MKKLGFLAFLFFFLLAFPGQGQAASGATHIKLDGREIKLTKDSQVQEISGSVLVPLRVIVEELGYNVNWDSKTKKISIEQGGNTLDLTLNKKTAHVNGAKIIMPAAPLLKGNITYVPLRFVSEQTGLKVLWDNKLKTAFLTSPDSESGSDTGSNSGTTAGNVSGNSTPVPAPGGSSDTGTSSGSAGNGASGTTGGQSQLASINGISFSDNRLIVAIDGTTITKVSKLTGPDRIVVDLTNTKFSDSFLSGQPLNSAGQGLLPVTGFPDVKQVRYSLFSSNPSTVRLVLDLNYSKGYQLLNAGDGLVIVDLNQDSSGPATSPGGNGKKLVVIDAGHGGQKDPGAISITGKYEKTFTLAVVLKVQELLKKEPDIDFVLTRSDDTYPTLSDRVKIANDLNADLFVSVHGNSAVATATGSETYYTRPDSIELANVMHKYLVEATGLPDRKVRQKSLQVTRETKMPAVLLEVGYLSNKNDEALMYDDAFQERVAEGIVAGIKEYLGLQ
ncbi:AMIN domain-containing protein [Paenibacillus zeisoli]|uniref:AMIN domain-containing protein n=2 Tax=Paenibacillus zeisoli TaxID=2496267 RepID=A0A433XR98_9BACL|nr:N-acetylmuramoyl-L-alanine amidase family protein [Paenibacillus zeisoli]RUT36600.1 AMIN domain-containing protein [Paenibacillus zeisoli]